MSATGPRPPRQSPSRSPPSPRFLPSSPPPFPVARTRGERRRARRYGDGAGPSLPPHRTCGGDGGGDCGVGRVVNPLAGALLPSSSSLPCAVRRARLPLPAVFVRGGPPTGGSRTRLACAGLGRAAAAPEVELAGVGPRGGGGGGLVVAPGGVCSVPPPLGATMRRAAISAAAVTAVGTAARRVPYRALFLAHDDGPLPLV